MMLRALLNIAEDKAAKNRQRSREVLEELRKHPISATNFIVDRLEKRYKELIENDRPRDDIKRFRKWAEKHEMLGWEVWFCPDTICYDSVLEHLSHDDVVLDVGAGDLRFAILASERVKKVYAVEVNPTILGGALKTIGYDLPRNVIPFCANIFDVDAPSDVNVAVILMRHCDLIHCGALFDKFAELKIIHNFGGDVQVSDRVLRRVRGEE